MRQLLQRTWQEDDGVLSFEWVMLVTLLTIGIVSGLAGARDAIIDELGDLAEAAQGIDQSYTLSGITLNLTINGIPFTGTVQPSDFQENATDVRFIDCGRQGSPSGQGVVNDGPS